MSEFIKVLLLGLVEGLTEFLPVSSTGHLILVSDALNFHMATRESFEVFIQLGAILAVVLLYWSTFLSFFDSLFSYSAWKATLTVLLHARPRYDRSRYSQLDPVHNEFKGPYGVLCLAAVTVPALVLGALVHNSVKALFVPLPVALALIFGGLVFLAVERRASAPIYLSLDQLTPGVCLAVGLFQACALWPGISRSGATLVGALLLGVDRRVAADLSFLAAVPIITAASVVDFSKIYHTVSLSDLQFYLVGLVASFIAGAASIKILISALKRFSLLPFAIYRIVLGGAVLIGCYC